MFSDLIKLGTPNTEFQCVCVCVVQCTEVPSLWSSAFRVGLRKMAKNSVPNPTEWRAYIDTASIQLDDKMARWMNACNKRHLHLAFCKIESVL